MIYTQHPVIFFLEQPARLSLGPIANKQGVEIQINANSSKTTIILNRTEVRALIQALIVEQAALGKKESKDGHATNR